MRWQIRESILQDVRGGRLGFGSSSSGLRDPFREGEGLGSSANAVEESISLCLSAVAWPLVGLSA